MQTLKIDTTWILNTYTIEEKGKEAKAIYCNNMQFEKLFNHWERFDALNMGASILYKIISRKLPTKKVVYDSYNNIISFWRTKLYLLNY